LLVGRTMCRDLHDLPDIRGWKRSTHTRRGASSTTPARGIWRSEQSLNSTRGVLCTREDGAASDLGQSKVTVHVCSSTTMMRCVGDPPTQVDYGTRCCPLSRSRPLRLA